MTAARRIGLALGGGGARGLAHLHALEAFDELGVRPAAIAGCSIGSLYGAGFAAGLSARELRDHTNRALDRRAEVVGKLLKARVGRLSDMFGAGSRNPILLDAETLVPLFLPDGVPQAFEQLEIPFHAVATDFFEHAQVVFSDGPLVPAIASSSAIPGIFRPVLHGGRTLIDGAMINPLPFDVFGDAVDATLAVDVTGGPVVSAKGFPNVFETLLGATQIMQAAIVAGKVAIKGPDALIRPKVDGVTLLDFFKTGPALRASEPAKDETKRAIERLMAD